MRVCRTPHPKASQLWLHFQTGDFMDGYAVETTLPLRQALEAGFDMPGWADGLMRLRNVLVKPFGLKTDALTSGQNQLFPITYESLTEIVMGTDDRHLEFRISLLRQGANIHMATWVHPHNWLGHAYLALVMPFHRLLSRNTMKRIAAVD